MDMMAVLVMAGVLATILMLFQGIASMAEGGENDARRANQLMFARVGLQGITVLFILIAVLMQVA